MAGLEPSHGAAVESRVAAFAEALARAGFDFVAPFVAHASGHPEAIASLETFGRASALGLVVGNSKALHPIFFGVLSREPSLRASADPLDAYAERELGRAAASTFGAVRHALRFAHDGTSGFLPIQRIAVATGRVWLGESGLVVHPTFGPWLGLRAVITVDAAPLALAPRVVPACVCASHCAPRRRALDALLREADAALLADRHRDFLAMRDACPVGRDHRYDEDAIAYHYTKDRAALERAIARHASPGRER